MSKTDDGKKDAVGSSFTTVDVMSPYYVSPSDYPGQLHVANLLNDVNYGEWATEMKNVLLAKNKIGFVNGSMPEPEGKSSQESALWNRCNAMVKGWLHTAMEKEIKSSVMFATTAREVWEDIKERFGKQSAPRAFELKRAVSSTRQNGQSVSTYYTKLKGFWDEIQSISSLSCCTCGVAKQFLQVREKERLYEFLLGLDDSFAVVRTQILSTVPTPSLSSAYHLVAKDERQRQIASRRTTVDAAAFQAQYNKVDRGGGAGRKTRCDKCKKTGHTIDTFFEIHGYLEWWKGKRATENTKTRRSIGGRMGEKGMRFGPQAAHVTLVRNLSPIPGITHEQFTKMAEYFAGMNNQPSPNSDEPVANMVGKINNVNSWVIDSGATEHITCHASIILFVFG